jgi:cellulose synthase/poly-beta-1,6-N-acetylglucosamine synthase-like glycosyltransferase
MVRLIESLNFFALVIFFLCYSYQLIYVGVRFLKKMPECTARSLHKYAVVIAARNESLVIGQLLDSLAEQRYPKELLDVFVVADNCTDRTAEVARGHGATVFERFHQIHVGKGYALQHAFAEIDSLCGIEAYEGYLVLDADNVLDPDYVREINKVFDAGYRVVTSYRNSKNYGSNWISAGYSLWFLRESKYLNGARMLLNTSCAISGTGFLVSSEVIAEDRGWHYHLLTEDIEFSTDKIIRGNRIGYCEKAVLYDEQPVDFKASWNQRMRWTRGFYQVMYHYGKKLLYGCFVEKRFSCFDILMTIAPATLLTILTLVLNLWFSVWGLVLGQHEVAQAGLMSIWHSAGSIYLSLLLFGLITVITEWKHIYCSPLKKILYLFTFPVFMFTYLPIAIAAIFKHVTWVPIRHTLAVKTAEIRR